MTETTGMETTGTAEAERRVYVRLTDQQIGFKDSGKTFVGYVGGRGAGKSFASAARLLSRALHGRKRTFGMYAPTYKILRDTIRQAFLELAMPYLYHVTEFDIWLCNGTRIITRSLDEPQHARGANLSGAVIDEAQGIAHEAFLLLIATLRERGEMGWCSCSFTPRGLRHWTYKVFGGSNPRAATFHSATRDNPYLPPEFEDTMRANYPSKFARQELDGLFIDLSGGVAQREWFPVVLSMPEAVKRVRAWDLAATVKQTADFMVGTRISKGADGLYYVEHVIRDQFTPVNVEKVIKQTAAIDTKAVPVIVEQEGGASGKIVASSITRALEGFNVVARYPRGDKLTRAMPFIRQAEAGNVRLVAGDWNEAWLDEITAFPEGDHDDQVDSAAHAFNELVGGSSIPAFVVSTPRSSSAASIRRTRGVMI